MSNLYLEFVVLKEEPEIYSDVVIQGNIVLLHYTVICQNWLRGFSTTEDWRNCLHVNKGIFLILKQNHLRI